MNKNPFVSLTEYQLESSATFNGRTNDVEYMLSVLQKNKIITLTGVEGSGKSSLINAGLLPRLGKGFVAQAGKDWIFASMRPGVAPMTNLIYALTKNGLLNSSGKTKVNDLSDYKTAIANYSELGVVQIFKESEAFQKKNLLVVVDQFEDIFTMDGLTDEIKIEQKLFADIISRSVTNKDVSVYFVIAIKSNYLNKVIEFPKLQELIGESQVLIKSIDKNAILSIVKDTFSQNSITFDPEVINKLSFELSEDPRLMPAAQFLFHKIFEEGQNQQVTLSKLEAYGGLQQIMRNSFKNFVENLSPEDKELFKWIIIALPNFEENEAPYPNITFEKLCAITGKTIEELSDFIDKIKEDFGNCFEILEAKINSSQSKRRSGYELDSILTLKYFELWEWNELSDWIKEEKENYRLYADLNIRVSQTHNQQGTNLLRSPELDTAIKWKNSQFVNQQWANKYSYNFDRIIQFINASEKDKTDKTNQEERLVQEKKKIRKKVLFWMAFLLIISVLTSIKSIYSGYKANESANQAKESMELAYNNALEAKKQQNIAVKNQNIANQEKNNAEKAKDMALEAKNIAIMERAKVVESEKKANEKTRQAIEAESIAKLQQMEAIKQTEIANKAKAESDRFRQIREFEASFFLTSSRLESLINQVDGFDDDKVMDEILSISNSSLSDLIEYRKINKNHYENEASYLLLQTMLMALEQKDFYSQTSMLIKKASNSGLRTIAVFKDNIVATGGDDQNVYLLNAETRKETKPISFSERIRKIYFANSTKLMVGLYDGKVYSVNLTNPNNIAQPQLVFASQGGAIKDIFLDNGRMYVVAETAVDYIDSDNSVKNIWKDNVVSASFSAKGIVLISSLNRLFVYQNDQLVQVSLDSSIPQNSAISAIEKSDGTLFLGTKFGIVYLYTIGPKANSYKFSRSISGHLTEITKLKYDPINNTLFSASFDNRVNKNFLSGNPRNPENMFSQGITLYGHEKWVWDLNTIENKDGSRLLITADENGSLLSWFIGMDKLIEKIQLSLKQNLKK